MDNINVTLATTKPHVYTVSQKVPAFKLSVTLSNLNRFSKSLHGWKAYKICYKYDVTHLTLGISYVATLSTLPWEIKN